MNGERASNFPNLSLVLLLTEKAERSKDTKARLAEAHECQLDTKETLEKS
jgi:hypothetical protein